MSIFFLPFLWWVLKSSEKLSHHTLDFLLKGFTIGVGIVIPCGYLLSALDLIGSSISWLVTTNLLAFAVWWFIRSRVTEQHYTFNFKTHFYSIYHELNIFGKLSLGILSIGLVITSIINLFVLFSTVPNEWDSMTGHLVKCAYYIQNGNMDRLEGTSWSIDYYPNSLPTLQIFGFHLLGEIGFKLIHYLSFWAFAIGIAAVARQIFQNKKVTLFTFLMAALLPSALIQAVTTETDIVQSAYLGIVVYFIIELWGNFNKANLRWLCLTGAIWISHKVTFLLIGPAIFLLFLFMIWKNRRQLKPLLAAVPVFILCLAVYVIPNGYISNLQQAEKLSLGAMSAPEEVMKWHGIENYSTKDKFRNFKLNILRYGSDYIHLDGIRNTEIGQILNEKLRIVPNKILAPFDLERDEFWVVAPFETMGSPEYEFYKERPYWGIIGFVLFPFAIVFLFLKGKNTPNRSLLFVLVWAWVLHFLSLSFSAPYDPIKGRYFMNTAIWALPVIGLLFLRKSNVLMVIASFLIVWAAISTLSHRSLYPLVGERNIFESNRIEQLTALRVEFTDAYENFDKRVPDDAIVALGTQQEHEDYIYPLWGKNFKRTLIPIHPFRSKVKPIPDEAEYLFYSEGVIPYQEGDILLGGGDKTPDTPVPESTFYLRKLK